MARALWQVAWRRVSMRLGELRASRPVRKLGRDRLALVCLGIICLYALAALLCSLGVFATAYEARVGENYSPPSPGSWHLWLGTDRLGRSIMVRMIYSAKIAFSVGLVSSLIGVVVGGLLGGMAGYFGKRVDELIVWLYSTIQSIPHLLLLIAITYALKDVVEGGLTRVYLAFGVTYWIGPCRLIRGEVLKLREAEYVQAARAMGYGHARILLRHVLPNTMHLMLVSSALLFVGAIKSEVILSFLGLGVQGEPSWGIMINQARAELINGFYWQIGAATAAMFGLVLCFNIFADALQDALDPKSL